MTLNCETLWCNTRLLSVEGGISSYIKVITLRSEHWTLRRHTWTRVFHRLHRFIEQHIVVVWHHMSAVRYTGVIFFSGRSSPAIPLLLRCRPQRQWQLLTDQLHLKHNLTGCIMWSYRDRHHVGGRDTSERRNRAHNAPVLIIPAMIIPPLRYKK